MVLDGSMSSRITPTVLGLAAEIERELISLRTTEALAKCKAKKRSPQSPFLESMHTDVLSKGISKIAESPSTKDFRYFLSGELQSKKTH
jgi:DNA invertase Pin-like site-specific DNA recombinase